MVEFEEEERGVEEVWGVKRVVMVWREGKRGKVEVMGMGGGKEMVGIMGEGVEMNKGKKGMYEIRND